MNTAVAAGTLSAAIVGLAVPVQAGSYPGTMKPANPVDYVNPVYESDAEDSEDSIDLRDFLTSEEAAQSRADRVKQEEALAGGVVNNFKRMGNKVISLPLPVDGNRNIRSMRILDIRDYIQALDKAQDAYKAKVQAIEANYPKVIQRNIGRTDLTVEGAYQTLLHSRVAYESALDAAATEYIAAIRWDGGKRWWRTEELAD